MNHREARQLVWVDRGFTEEVTLKAGSGVIWGEAVLAEGTA